jgi:hypothetical protein
MNRLPNSLFVSLWGIGVCWIAVAIAYLTDSDMVPIDSLLVSLAVLLLVPLAVIGALGRMIQWPPEHRL